MLQKTSTTTTTIPLKNVIKAVSRLYLGDLRSLIENIYRKPALASRDEIWQKEAESFPEYSSCIIQLRKVLKKAYLARYNASLQVNSQMDAHFSHVGDGDAAALLIDLLYARIMSEGATPEKNSLTEEDKIKKELGLSPESRLTEENITLEDVIIAILENRLQLPPAT